MRDLYVEARIAFHRDPDVRLATRDLGAGRQQLLIVTTEAGRRFQGTMTVDLGYFRRDEQITMAAEDARRYYRAARAEALNVEGPPSEYPTTWHNDMPAPPPEWTQHATSGGFNPYTRLGRRR